MLLFYDNIILIIRESLILLNHRFIVKINITHFYTLLLILKKEDIKDVNYCNYMFVLM